MKYRLLLMDMDSTLINEEGIDILAEKAGVGDQVTELTTNAMAGDLDFYSSLQQRVSLLKGQPVTTLAEVRSALSFTKGAITLIERLKGQGYRIGVVSGGFHEIIDDLLHPLELDFLRANRFEIKDDQLTGSVLEPIIGPREKAIALREFADSFDIDLDSTIAIGDGANDKEMLKTSALGIAFCAKPVLRSSADLVIDERDLLRVLEYLD